MAMQYQKLEQERVSLVSKGIEINEEKREYSLVIEVLKDVEEDRKCWRLINGVLVEKPKKEIIPDLQTSIENMENLWKQLDDRVSQIRTAMGKIEDELGHSINEGKKMDSRHEGDESKTSGGVLV